MNSLLATVAFIIAAMCADIAVAVVSQVLRSQETQFRSAFDHAPSGTALLSLSGHESSSILHVNPALRRRRLHR